MCCPKVSRKEHLAMKIMLTDYAFAGKLFNWALAREIVEHSPCAGIRINELVGKQESRQRVLSDAEIRALWQATGTLGYPAAPFVRMLLLTGQRLREVANAQWQEFGLDNALWVISSQRMKTGTAHEVPLAPMAVEILKSLPRWASGNFVF
jgi:integrase